MTMFQLNANKTALCIAAISAVLLFCASPAWASDWLTYGTSTQWQPTSVPMTSVPSRQEVMYKIAGRIDYLQSAKELINVDIRNNMGETLGSVKELILDDTRDVVRYVVLESNGTLHPVPWAALTITPDSIVLNVDKSKFADSPQISTNYLEKLNNADFRKDIRTFYSGQIAPAAKPTSSTMEPPVIRICSNVIGLKVQNIQGENLADVKNLIIDTHQGEIAYGLVGFGGFFGIGERTAAVPWTSLEIQPSANVAYLDADRATLETAVVDERNLAKLTERQFAQNVHENFGAKPYWEVLGFVPPAEKGSSLAAWQAGSKYNNFFDPENMTTIDGTIQSIGIFTPEWGATAGLKLVVEIGENEFVVVHGGPEQYAAQREINFKVGSPITVMGSETKIGNESVIMATEIKIAGKSLLLRDDMGAPKWNVEQMEREYKQESETEHSYQLRDW
jgi:sporulation protein YlmC with PRC-barrel domain